MQAKKAKDTIKRDGPKISYLCFSRYQFGAAETQQQCLIPNFVSGKLYASKEACTVWEGVFPSRFFPFKEKEEGGVYLDQNAFRYHYT